MREDIYDRNKYKFRAWDEQNKKWVYFTLLDLTLINQESLIDDEYAILQLKNVGQYTGIEDKNGKEIYEGDILQDQYYDIAKVFYNRRYAGFNVRYKDGVMAFPHNGMNVKVIGNIYDNKNLLGDENEN